MDKINQNEDVVIPQEILKFAVPIEENDDQNDQLVISPKNIECYDKSRIIDPEKNEKFIEENTCPVCLNLIKDTCQCQFGCSGLFGYECIAHNAISSCPFCRKTFEDDKTSYRNPVIAKLHSGTIQLRCENHDNGCGEVLKYHKDIISEHEKSCPHKVISCPQKKQGCTWKDKKVNLKSHLEKCKFYSYRCKFCKELNEVDQKFLIKDMSLHFKDCLNEKVYKILEEIQEKIELKKQKKPNEVSKDDNDLLDVGFLEKMKDTFQQQNSKIKDLNLKIEEMIKYNALLETNSDKARDKTILLNDFNKGIINFNSLEILKETLDKLDKKFVKGVRWNENCLKCYQFSFKSETDFKQTIDYIEALAKGGEKYSQYSLARLFIFGDKDIPRNVDQALLWVNKSIEQNCAEGKYLLGRIQHNSADKKVQDFESLLDLVNSASQLGNPEAKNFLGFVYGKGEGIAQNQKKALQFYRKAAEQGNFAALLNLGSYYEGGYGGLDVDPVKSFGFFEKSAKKGYINAMIKVVQLLKAGKGVDKDEYRALKWEERIQHHTEFFTHSIQWSRNQKQDQ